MNHILAALGRCVRMLCTCLVMCTMLTEQYVTSLRFTLDDYGMKEGKMRVGWGACALKDGVAAD